MINWISLGVALVGVCAVAVVLECSESYGWTLVIGVVSGFVAVVILLACPIARISHNSDCSVFAQQKLTSNPILRRTQQRTRRLPPRRSS